MNVQQSYFTEKRQGYELEQLGTIGVVQVRATVYVDSYTFQCRAQLEAWSPTDLRWSQVTRLASELVATDAPSYAVKDARVKLAHVDKIVDQLVHDAELVLGVTV